MWFAYPREEAWIPLPISKVKEIQQQNRDGVIPADLGEMVELETKPAKALDYENVVGQDSLTRLDERRNNNNKNKNKNKSRNSKNPNQTPQQANQPRPAGVVQNNRPPRPEGSRPVDGNRPKAPRPENNKPVDGNIAEVTRPEGAKPQGNNQNRRHKHRRPNQNNQNRPGNNPGPSAE